MDLKWFDQQLPFGGTWEMVWPINAFFFVSR
jgi:hypothetical protein